MESLAEIIKKYFTPQMRGWYRPSARGKCLFIHHPAFVSMIVDEHFKVEESECSVGFINNHFDVTVWKNVELLYVVIF